MHTEVKSVEIYFFTTLDIIIALFSSIHIKLQTFYVKGDEKEVI